MHYVRVCLCELVIYLCEMKMHRTIFIHYL